MSDDPTTTDAGAAGEATPPKLPDLELVRSIGRGAFGEVWLATNQVTGALLAVKVVPFEAAGGSTKAEREIASLIRYEAGVRHKHENLLTIHHVGQVEDALFYTMDPADDLSGGPASLSPDYKPATLAAMLEAGPLPAERCLHLARQLVDALACLHGEELAHRDVKPANCIFVDGRLRLADFGLLTPTDSTVSRIGTLRYMPPDGRMDAGADVYAAGLIIYEMLTGLPADCFPRWGRRAIDGGNDLTLTALNRLVLVACRRDSALRYRDGREMSAALDDLLTAARQRGRRNRWTAAIAAICVAAAVVLGGVWLSRRQPKRIHVNFISVPYEAEIYIDGRLAVDADGKPHTTPCTIDDLSAKTCRVVFKKDGYPPLDLGEIDLAGREVIAEWPPRTRLSP